jgi:hypothetical protein
VGVGELRNEKKKKKEEERSRRQKTRGKRQMTRDKGQETRDNRQKQGAREKKTTVKSNIPSHSQDLNSHQPQVDNRRAAEIPDFPAQVVSMRPPNTRLSTKHNIVASLTWGPTTKSRAGPKPDMSTFT